MSQWPQAPCCQEGSLVACPPGSLTPPLPYPRRAVQGSLPRPFQGPLCLVAASLLVLSWLHLGYKLSKSFRNEKFYFQEWKISSKGKMSKTSNDIYIQRANDPGVSSCLILRLYFEKVGVGKSWTPFPNFCTATVLPSCSPQNFSLQG